MVAEERPDLEEAKNALIVSNAKMKQELKEIEDQILYRLSNAEGNPVDDVDLIKVLEASKIKSQEISVSKLLTSYTLKSTQLIQYCLTFVECHIRTVSVFFLENVLLTVVMSCAVYVQCACKLLFITG